MFRSIDGCIESRVAILVVHGEGHFELYRINSMYTEIHRKNVKYYNMQLVFLTQILLSEISMLHYNHIHHKFFFVFFFLSWLHPLKKSSAKI